MLRHVLPRQIAIGRDGILLSVAIPHNMPDSKGIGALPQAILFGIVFGNVRLRNSNKGKREMNTICLKTLNRQIGEIKRSGKALQDKIVSVEIKGMWHALQCGNHTPLTNLVLALPASARRKALILHIVDHSPLKWDDEKNCFMKSKRSQWEEQQINAAIETPFYEYSVEKEPKALDLDKLLCAEKLLDLANKQIEKALKEGREIKGDQAAFAKRATAFQSLVA